MVFTLVGMGAAVLWRGGSRGAISKPSSGATAPSQAAATSPTRVDRSVVPGRVLAVVGVVALVAFGLANQPPAVHPDGGFPGADRAAARIVASGGQQLTLRSLPDFKSTEAYGYPLIRAGASVTVNAGSGPVAQEAGTLVIICDALYATAIGAPCGGPAEAVVAPPARFGDPIDRFEAAPGRTISVYRAGS
jgi:hypothetical protein